METRRRTQRVTLLQPIAARAGNERAYVVDVSVSGVRIFHHTAFPERKPYPISLDWEGTPIEFTAEPRWTKAQAGEYESGLEIQAIDPASRNALRRLIEGSVAPLYECHELIHGVWRRKPTTDSRQPESGFTVLASESPHTIDFFRVAYARGNHLMRERIRRLAQLSIEHPERHYDA
jgi:PilZ domain